MNSIIIILMLVCGQPDTVIVKYPDKQSMFSHNLKSPAIMNDIAKVLSLEHVLIVYEDERSTCA